MPCSVSLPFQTSIHGWASVLWRGAYRTCTWCVRVVGSWMLRATTMLKPFACALRSSWVYCLRAISGPSLSWVPPVFHKPSGEGKGGGDFLFLPVREHRADALDELPQDLLGRVLHLLQGGPGHRPAARAVLLADLEAGQTGVQVPDLPVLGGVGRVGPKQPATLHKAPPAAAKIALRADVGPGDPVLPTAVARTLVPPSALPVGVLLGEDLLKGLDLLDRAAGERLPPGFPGEPGRLLDAGHHRLADALAQRHVHLAGVLDQHVVLLAHGSSKGERAGARRPRPLWMGQREASLSAASLALWVNSSGVMPHCLQISGALPSRMNFCRALISSSASSSSTLATPP